MTAARLVLGLWSAVVTAVSYAATKRHPGGGMNNIESFAADLHEQARARGLRVWEGLPADAPGVAFPRGSTASDIIEFAQEAGTQMVYLHTEHDPDAGVVLAAAGVAVHRVVHHLVHADETFAGGQSEWHDDEEPEFGLRLAFDHPGWSGDDEWVSWSEREYQRLSPELQSRVDQIIDDPTYDPWSRGHNLELLERVAGALDVKDYAHVKEVARSRWRDLHGEGLDAEAERVAARLISRPDVDPFNEWNQWDQWVAERTDGLDPRVVSRAARQLQGLVHEKGLRQKAERELEQRARQLLTQLSPLQRDQLGFTSRVNQREDLLGPFVDDLEDVRRDWVLRLVARLEEEQFGREREGRYATAATILIRDHGLAKTATSRALGLSPTVIDRLLRENPDRVVLADDDPIRGLHDALASPGSGSEPDNVF